MDAAAEPEPGSEEGVADALQFLMDDASGDLAVGDLEAALAKYRQAVALDSSFFDGWHALGMALMKTGRYAEAIEAGLQATRLRQIGRASCRERV